MKIEINEGQTTESRSHRENKQTPGRRNSIKSGRDMESANRVSAYWGGNEEKLTNFVEGKPS
ncbi:hypothetical protein JXI42_01575 [bacterium]|nr:hypothetical protein [bacterium]